jgi:hypothetical protein
MSLYLTALMENGQIILLRSRWCSSCKAVRSPFIVNGTGHFLNLHFSAQETFTKANDWLESVGF